MSSNQVQLKPSSILKVPLQSYAKDFTFIVNGKEYETSLIVSDLLSTKISQIHLSDPTFNIFTINTQHDGNFSHILNLCQFDPISFPENELPFFLEVIEILQPDYLECKGKNRLPELTVDNVFSLLNDHLKFSTFYRSEIESEITFISRHFTEIVSKQKEELKRQTIDTLISIVSNPNLQLEDEDELLEFANEIYREDRKMAAVFEFVRFENASSRAMANFTENFDIEDIDGRTWLELCRRLRQEVKRTNDSLQGDGRYIEKGVTFPSTNEFRGIINYLTEKSSGRIENEVNITASSVYNSDERFQPRNVALFNDQSKFFLSASNQDSWICYDFKDRNVAVSGYTVRSSVNSYANGHQPVSWCIEGSNDNVKWETIDDQKNCSFLNNTQTSVTHTFNVNNENKKKFKYIRMRQTDKNRGGDYYLFIDSLEIYGNLI